MANDNDIQQNLGRDSGEHGRNSDEHSRDGRELGRASRGDSAALHNLSRVWPDEEGRPSRESLIRAYDADSATRARNVRLNAQDAIRERANRPPRQPLSSKESHEQAVSSRDAFERARATRNASQLPQAARRGGPREVIDGRGSFDSRAFNERSEIVGYTIDASDRHELALDEIGGSTRWRSSAGDRLGGADGYGARFGRRPDLGNLSDTISSRSDYRGSQTHSKSAASIKVLIVLIIILLIILIVLMVS